MAASEKPHKTERVVGYTRDPGQGTTSEPGDVIAFLRLQHQEIETLLNKVSLTRGSERQNAFFELRRLLAIHETAEEIVIHPESRSVLPDGENIVRQRLQEEADMKKVLSRLETLDADSPEFEAMFNDLKWSVISHAELEETEEFDPLYAVLDHSRLETLKGRLQMAEKIAPTRAHPGAGESATGNLLAGPFIAIVDRIRDSFTTAGK